MTATRPRSRCPRPVAALVSATLGALLVALPHPAAAAPRDCPCYGTGDVDGNGVLSAGDAQTALAIALGMLSPTPAQACAADTNGDGAVSASDAQNIFEAVRGAGDCPAELPAGACCEAHGHCQSGQCAAGVCTEACVRFVVADATAQDPDGLAWDTAFSQVQPAVEAAHAAVQAGAPACEVWVAAGSYRGAAPGAGRVVLMRPGVHLYGGFGGDETSLDERDPAIHETVLDGRGTAPSVVYGADEATLDGFTIVSVPPGALADRATGTRRPASSGGDPASRARYTYGLVAIDSAPAIRGCTFVGLDRAIRAEDSALRVSGCTFYYNDLGVSTEGGAPAVSDSTFVGNAAGLVMETGTVSGCVLVDNDQGLAGGPVVTASRFEGNALAIGATFRGPDVYDSTFVANTTAARITEAGLRATNCVFRGNRQGIRLTNYHAGGRAELDGCTFDGNGPNSALDICYNCEANIRGSTFLHNTGPDGGAIANLGGLTATNSHFVANDTAGFGGAIYNVSSGRATVTSSVFVDNTAGGGGGAIFSRATLTVTNCTFAGNVAAAPGGALAGAGSAGRSAHVTNSIFWSDFPSEIVPGVAQVTFSNVQGGYAGEGNLDADPLFVDLEARDLHLGPGSPCIDRAAGDVAPPFDFDGNARYDDPATPNQGTGEPPYADLGAFEYGGQSTR